MKKGKEVSEAQNDFANSGTDLSNEIPSTVKVKGNEVPVVKLSLAEIAELEKAGKAEPKQLNYNNRNFEAGDSELFEFLGMDSEIQDDKGDYYEGAILKREDGTKCFNADVVLMSTLKPLEHEAPFIIKVTCAGLRTPKNGNKAYKDLTILRY